jgi:hypothetical protein
MNEQEAARTLKAYFLQHRKGEWEKSQLSYLEARSCALGTCGSKFVDVTEEEKKKELERLENVYREDQRLFDHDTIAIYRLQQIIEGENENNRAN